MKKNDFGTRFRALRKAKRITGQELAEKLGTNQSKISKIESGSIRPTHEFVVRFANAIGLTEAEKVEILAHAELFLAEYGPWQWDEADAFERRQAAVARLEASAREIRAYQSALVPGLLQTEEYIRAVLGALDRPTGADAGQLESDIRARLRRQKVLFSKKRFFFLLAENALRCRLGQPGVMVRQLSHIKAISSRDDIDNVRIGLVPWSMRVMKLPMSSFEIYDDNLVTIETLTGEVTVSDRNDVARHRTVFDSLASNALYEGSLAKALDDMAADYRGLDAG